MRLKLHRIMLNRVFVSCRRGEWGSDEIETLIQEREKEVQLVVEEVNGAQMRLKPL